MTTHVKRAAVVRLLVFAERLGISRVAIHSACSLTVDYCEKRGKIAVVQWLCTLFAAFGIYAKLEIDGWDYALYRRVVESVVVAVFAGPPRTRSLRIHQRTRRTRNCSAQTSEHLRTIERTLAIREANLMRFLKWNPYALKLTYAVGGCLNTADTKHTAALSHDPDEWIIATRHLAVPVSISQRSGDSSPSGYCVF